MEISRLARLSAILTQLQSKSLITATEIADKFDISIRTAYRDIRALEDAGVPIYTEEGKGYSLVEGYTLPPVMFTESEANAMITAAEIISKNKDQSLVRNYDDAMTKIRSVLRDNTKDKAELLSERVLYRMNPEGDRSSNNLSIIQNALTHFNVLSVQYRSMGKNEVTQRELEPFGLYSAKENWVLIAWCRLRREFRAFRLDHIEELTLLEETFEKHDYSWQQYFDDCRKNLSQHP